MTVGFEQINNRQLAIHKTAGKVIGNAGTLNTYSSTIASVLDKMERGEDTTNSSGAELISKINSGKDAQSLSQGMHSYSDFTAKESMKNKVNGFCESVETLLGQKEKSLFLKNHPASEETSKYFEISSTSNGAPFTMEVKQLAKAQKNESVTLEAEKKPDLSVGRHFFEISVDGKVTSLVARVTAQDTNASFLEKVASAINRAKCGVSAQVVEQGNKVSLQVECDGTGAPVKGQETVFSFSQSGEEEIVDKLNLNHIVENGQDAVFRYNNAEEDSVYMYNSVCINNTTTVQFKEVTSEPVSFSFDYDYDKINDAVENYVSFYNELKQMSNDSSYAVINSYFKQIRSVTGTYLDALSSVGITIDADGVMQYNAGTLYAAPVKDLAKTLNQTENSYFSSVKEIAEGLNGYMDRLTGKTKKYYGLKAKKRSGQLRQKLNNK